MRYIVLREIKGKLEVVEEVHLKKIPNKKLKDIIDEKIPGWCSRLKDGDIVIINKKPAIYIKGKFKPISYDYDNTKKGGKDLENKTENTLEKELELVLELKKE